MSLPHLLVFFLFLFIPFKNSAQQKEYVVSYDNDTIYGDVKRKSNLLNPSKVEFKIKLSNGERVDIMPREIKYIHTWDGLDGDSHFEAYAQYSFVKRVIDGRIKLYILPDTALYFISKDNSNIQPTNIGEPFSAKKAHAEVAALLRDKPYMLKEFETMKGSFKNISYIINLYNRNLNSSHSN